MAAACASGRRGWSRSPARSDEGRGAHAGSLVAGLDDVVALPVEPLRELSAQGLDLIVVLDRLEEGRSEGLILIDALLDALGACRGRLRSARQPPQRREQD
eukprot:CAMPEP_0197901490 /NCGR_PEP_ID=MMETSP1439-20131203/51144_1 /TAXON_ID=66791 /ORGANISM="Gonyaulax spinifera, Strain CCMP409" /LENGTH=100 /DNA_ID=CAMNT_0043522459 /DNA_START=46 /DNA_END=348 /DNA_ORIENTATION=+